MKWETDMKIAYAQYQSYQTSRSFTMLMKCSVNLNSTGNLEDLLLHSSTKFGKREVSVRSESFVSYVSMGINAVLRLSTYRICRTQTQQ